MLRVLSSCMFSHNIAPHPPFAMFGSIGWITALSSRQNNGEAGLFGIPEVNFSVWRRGNLIVAMARIISCSLEEAPNMPRGCDAGSTRRDISGAPVN